MAFNQASDAFMQNPSRSRSLTTKQRALNLSRQYYAEELRAVSNIQSEALVQAFAKVPREHFLGPGPWHVRSPGSDGYWTTKDADPQRLYHNILVAIDTSRQLNNGHPSFLAFLIDALELKKCEHVVHVGCGTGYYTAIMAEVVSADGHITAVEVDSDLASLARTNLSYLPHVRVLAGDGGNLDPGPCDAILVNAGATHPRTIWLDSLRPGARLLLPLTAADEESVGGGGHVLIVKRHDEGLAARFISEVGIFPCLGARDSQLNEKLKEAFKRGDAKSVRSLRRDPRDADGSCWLHGEQFCLSKTSIAP